MTPSKIFFYFCLSFVAGIFIGSLFSIPHNYLWGIVFFNAFVILFFLLKKHKLPMFLGFCLIFILFGILRYQTASFNIRNSSLKQHNEQEIILTGKILSEPDIRENSIYLTVGADKIIVGEEIIETSGKILVKVRKYPEYNYADILLLSGQLKTPQEFEDFNYKDYLAKKGIFSLMDWPVIEIIRKNDYSNWWQLGCAQILKFKNKIRENINQFFPYPESSLLGAMLLGDQSTMSQNLKDKLNITGLRHITAISGMNISILCTILMSLLLGLGFWRNQAFWISLAVIFIFVVMIGFQSSVVRAGIMGGMFLLGQKTGRLSTSSRAIVITAAAMLILNPMLLRWDVGFQLSFLALLGMIFLLQPIEGLMKFIPKDKFINLRTILATTFAAQIFTLPVLIYNFGRISLVSPLTNILILPVIYWIMIFGFLFGILSVIWGGFGWIFILPCWFLISYSMKIINVFSHPWAAKAIESIHWLWLVFFYLLLGFFVKWFRKKTRLKFLEY